MRPARRVASTPISGSIRIGLGRTTTAAEIAFALDRLIDAARRLRAG